MSVCSSLMSLPPTPHPESRRRRPPQARSQRSYGTFPRKKELSRQPCFHGHEFDGSGGLENDLEMHGLIRVYPNFVCGIGKSWSSLGGGYGCVCARWRRFVACVCRSHHVYKQRRWRSCSRLEWWCSRWRREREGGGESWGKCQPFPSGVK